VLEEIPSIYHEYDGTPDRDAPRHHKETDRRGGLLKKPLNRIKEHKAFKSTNYIMSVIRLIFRDALPQKKYDFEGHVILRCITHDDASIGEILLATIAQVYTTDGGGFCHQSAGGNVVSANDVEHLR
jgi:hypothetical protein